MRVTRLGENRSSGFFLDRKTDRQQIRGRWRLASFQRRVFHTTFRLSSGYFFFVSFSSTSLKRTCANKFSRAMIEEHRAIDVYSLSILEKDIFFIAYFYSSSIRAFVNCFSVECSPCTNDDYNYSIDIVALQRYSSIKISHQL